METEHPEEGAAFETEVDAEAVDAEAAVDAAAMPQAEEETPQVDWRSMAESRYDQIVRLQADFENFRRRMERERFEVRQQTLAGMAVDLLPVYDNLDRAMRYMPQEGDAKVWRVGVEMTLKGFDELLKGWGVEAVPAVGEPFNPAWHEALQRVSSELPEGIIVEEVLKGFRMGDRILRASQVKVSQGPESQSDAE